MVYPHHCNLAIATSSTTPVEDIITEEPILRIRQHKAMIDLEATIEALSAHKFSIAELKELNVDVRPLDLGENSRTTKLYKFPEQTMSAFEALSWYVNFPAGNAILPFIR
ncbi:hypothetical protein BDV06DRAFT_227016 [Aspergillus oleicola]